MVQRLKGVSLFAVLALLLSACSLLFESSGSVFDLSPGKCFNDPVEGGEYAREVTSLAMVDCDDPHDNEVFANFDVEDGAFPGVAGLDDVAAAGCAPLFESYVGSSYEDTVRLDIMWLSPTAESWAGGDRTVTCVLYNADLAELVGSQAGTGA